MCLDLPRDPTTNHDRDPLGPSFGAGWRPTSSDSGCPPTPVEDEDEDISRDRTALADFLRSLTAHGPVQLDARWDGEQSEPPDAVIDSTVDDFVRDWSNFCERSFVNLA